MSGDRRILLVDGNNLLHRICHVPAFHDLKTHQGVHAGGTFGLLKSLRKSLDMGNYIRCIVTWDKGTSARRLSLFEDYKNRSKRDEGKSPEILKDTEDYFKFYKFQRYFLAQILPDLGVDEISIGGREGDDVLFWVREHLKVSSRDQWHRCVILSEDLDFMQLVDDGTDLYRPIQDQYISVDNFKSVCGVTPARFLLYKSMLGDKSDNVPGIKGVGPAASAEVSNAVSVDEEQPTIYAPWDWDEVKDYCSNHRIKKIQSIAERFDQVRLNFKLFCILEETAEDEDIQQVAEVIYHPNNRDLKAVMAHFQKGEFTELLGDFASWSIPFRRLACDSV